MNEVVAPATPRQSARAPQGGDDLRAQSGPIGRARVDEQIMDAHQLHDCAVAVVRGGFTPRSAVTIPKEAYFEK